MSHISPTPSPNPLTLTALTDSPKNSDVYVSLQFPPHVVPTSPPLFRERLVQSIKKSREAERQQRLKTKMTKREQDHLGNNLGGKKGKKGVREVETASSRRRVRAQQKMYGFEASEVAGLAVGSLELVGGEEKKEDYNYLMENRGSDPNSLSSTTPLPHRQLNVHNNSTQTRSGKQTYVILRGTPSTRKWSGLNRPSSAGQPYSSKSGAFAKDIYNPVTEREKVSTAPGGNFLKGKGLQRKKVRPKSARAGLQSVNVNDGGLGVRGKAQKNRRPQSARVGNGRGQPHPVRGDTLSPPAAYVRPQSAMERSQSAKPKVTYRDFMPKVVVERRGSRGEGGDGGEVEKKEEEKQRQAALEYYEKKKDPLSMGIAEPEPIQIEGSQEIMLDGGVHSLVDLEQDVELTDEMLGVVDDDEGDEDGIENEIAFGATTTSYNGATASATEDFKSHAEFSQWVDAKVDPFIKVLREEIVKRGPTDLKAFTAEIMTKMQL